MWKVGFLVWLVTGVVSSRVAIGQPQCEHGGPYGGLVNQLIQFDGSGSYSPDGYIILYQWYFGDGGTSQGAMATHAYTEIGVYTVTLVVTEDDYQYSVCETTADIGPVAVEPRSWGRIKRFYLGVR